LIFLPALYVLWFRIPPELERRPAPIAEAVAQPAS